MTKLTRHFLITTLPPALLGVLGAALVILWIGGSRVDGLVARQPGADGTPAPVQNADDRPPVAGQPIRGDGVPAAIAGSWPAFRGTARDAISRDRTPLARAWPPDGPPVLWRITLGEGYASAAVQDGRVYVLDYDEPAQADTMRCLSLADGREIWRNSYPAQVARNHGMSRTTPALVDDCVVSIGPRCHVACWDAETGQCRWLIDMVRQFGSEERQWYTGQCPLVDGDRVIMAPCGKDALLVAVDYRAGRVIWQTPNPRHWKMSHCSIMPMQYAGRAMYVYCGTGGTVGVSADDGSILWDETSWVEHFATSPSPLPLPDGRIFLCSGYDRVGAMMLRLKQTDGAIAVQTEFTLRRNQFNSEHQTPIYYQGYLYGVRKFRGGQLVCMDLEGNERWNSEDLQFEHGPYMIADGLIFALSGDGLLATIEATHEAFRPRAQFQVFEDGHDAWGPMAMVAGRLIVRDMTRMVCLDVRDQR